jgi:hypothetical protein
MWTGCGFCKAFCGIDFEHYFSFPDCLMVADAQVSLHPCVRFGLFEREKTLSFIPPDGRFEVSTRDEMSLLTLTFHFVQLMKYRVADPSQFSAPVSCNSSIVYTVDESRLRTGVRAPCPLNSLQLLEPHVGCGRGRGAGSCLLWYWNCEYDGFSQTHATVGGLQQTEHCF